VPRQRASAGWNSSPKVQKALKRYRVIAYVVGVGLIILVCIGVPLRYLAHFAGVVAVVGPLHGALYIVYLLAVADLSLRLRWWPVRTVLVMLAGTVPFLSFVAERYVTRHVDAQVPSGR
jgi:integral membrane protein